ncbi:MAG: hypothetical protein HKN33_06575 [Pyrinomonadaceae bacterium]|nr:hypothetical protein [Pyrinomonadaceae bacterium]
MKRNKNKHKLKTASAADPLNPDIESETDLQQTAPEAESTGSKKEPVAELPDFYSELFDKYESDEFEPQDFRIDVPIDSLESFIGYSSLLRQMHQAFIRRVAYYRSPDGGALSTSEAREKAFHACKDLEEAKELFETITRTPLESLRFADLEALYDFAPRVAERLWERIKREGRDEFESGHLASNITFPCGHMKDVWNIARFIGVRESFIDEWNPNGGIEVSLVDMLTQSFFQWQYWLEQTIKRSQTGFRDEHPEYKEWKEWKKESGVGMSWKSGSWCLPYVKEQEALEHAMKMVDRWNRIYMRTLRQLRDLRRYSVTINNPNQVNVANDGGKQVNISNPRENS